MKTRQLRAVLFCLFLAFALPAVAHHSLSAEYDSGKLLDLTGTITRVEWVNPHAWVEIDGKDPADGRTQHWKLEMASITCLVKHGISKETMTLGSTITVHDSWRAKDGSFHTPVFTMIYGNRSYRVQRSPSDPQVDLTEPDYWCAP